MKLNGPKKTFFDTVNTQFKNKEAVLNNKEEITENNDRVLITCLIVK